MPRFRDGICLLDLDHRLVEAADCLLQVNHQVLQGYLAEELFGWSISRFVCLNKKIVGLIRLSKLDVEKGYGLLGTWLHPSVWGTGVNRLAKDAFLQLIFAEHPAVKKVYLCISENNLRSVRAAKKLPYAEDLPEQLVPTDLVEAAASSVTGAAVDAANPAATDMVFEAATYCGKSESGRKWFFVDRLSFQQFIEINKK
ncbi:GNAT family N-acetyltransferase [Effusibacillus dendaii]|uniref:N-acetyltransferase domain-containing protein n=1 Tax=Effusibacillus dendaii TaxID=2743772 RepID=A0A7I8DFQ1_9BACL|nr:GNAT family N-acetyltransferase [Effusibacillus dendaii]BCJ86721.1 hypothetical protein skT53_17060 [Effusibacillus dendaii]